MTTKERSMLEVWMPRVAALGVVSGGISLLIANAIEAAIGSDATSDLSFAGTDSTLLSAAPADMTIEALRKENLTSHTLRTVASISFTVAGAAFAYDVFVNK